MQIVIDIDEARYKDIQRIAEVQIERNHFQTAEQIIARGVPIEQEPKWIPVSERLPEEDNQYLICFNDGELELDYCCKGTFSYSGVIAWIPLPEPYRAERSGEG